MKSLRLSSRKVFGPTPSDYLAETIFRIERLIDAFSDEQRNQPEISQIEDAVRTLSKLLPVIFEFERRFLTRESPTQITMRVLSGVQERIEARAFTHSRVLKQSIPPLAQAKLLARRIGNEKGNEIARLLSPWISRLERIAKEIEATL